MSKFYVSLTIEQASMGAAAWTLLYDEGEETPRDNISDFTIREAPNE